MDNTNIERLQDIAKQFRTYIKNTEDGKGESLHDIANSFRYVKGTLERLNIQGTTYGANLTSKVNEATSVLGDLWFCYRNLADSIDAFCESQIGTNNN